MSKELFISSSAHETKVAVCEDDELVEVYFQRDADLGLAGSIYKGRVSRVLPGMQSAFVDIGLERDAFLYVSDFFEESEEYDKVFSDAESRVEKLDQGPVAAAVAPVAAELAAPGSTVVGAPEASAQGEGTAGRSEVSAPPPAEATEVAPVSPEPGTGPSETAPRPVEFHSERGGRRRRRRGRFGESRFGRKPEPYPPADRRPEAAPQGGPASSFEVLPGETLAKYGHVDVMPEREDPAAEGTSTTEPPSVVDNQPESSPEMVIPTAPPTGEMNEPVEDDLLLGDLRVAPVEFQPESPEASPHAAEESSDFATSSAANSAEDTAASETGLTSFEDLPEEHAEAAAVPEAEESAETPGEEEPPSAATAAAGSPEPGAAETSAAGERTYTLQEPHQRPRFAPRRGRRGRGRFGPRSPRPEGGGYRRGPTRGGNTPAVQITEVLKEGQEILVQIAKEPLGTKGARITSHIALPGRYLVYMPTIHHIGVSRKIASEEERLRLRNIILEHRGSLTGGFIVRTAGAGKREEDLRADLTFLSGLWAEIRSRSERSRAPAMLHGDLTLVERILRDVLSPDFKSVRVDSEMEYAHVVEFVNRFQPSLVGHVKLYTRSTPLFEEFGVQREIDQALKPKVWLKSGGYIVINQTEALVAIDVNTGKYVGKTNRLEDTIVKTNIDAVNEIVRQIRLRDLGGIIVVDFIDMDDRRNRQRVVQALEDALRSDRAPTKILSFNEFGLVALTRKRVKQSLERTLSEPCPYCTGSGWVKSVSTICNEILAEARKMASEIEGQVVTLRVSPEVAKALKSRDGALLAEIESLTRKDVVVKPDAAVHQERFEIF